MQAQANKLRKNCFEEIYSKKQIIPESFDFIYYIL